MKEKNSFISHLINIGLGTIISMAIGFLTTPIITRIIDPTEYGKLSVFTMYAGFAVMFLCLGLDQSLVRFYYDNQKYENKNGLLQRCFSLPLIVSVIVGVFFIIAVQSGVIHFEFPLYICVALVVHIIILLWNRFAVLILRLEYNSKLYSLCTIVTKITYIVIVLLWIYIIHDNYIDGLILATIMSCLIPTLIAVNNKKDIWKINCKLVQIYDATLLKYGMPLILAMGIQQVFTMSDRLILNIYCSYDEVGIYSSANTLINLVVLVQTTFTTIWAPRQVEWYTNHPNDTSYIKKVNQIITIVMFFIGINLVMIKDLFVLLLGEKYRLSAYIMPFLMFNPIMYTISETMCSGIGKSKKSKLSIYTSVIACTSNIIGNYLLIPILGGRGAAISTGISYVIFLAARTYFSNKNYYIDYELGKFSVLTGTTLLFSLYNTFYQFNIVTIVLYIVNISVLLLLYKNTIFNCWKEYGKTVLSLFEKIGIDWRIKK